MSLRRGASHLAALALGTLVAGAAPAAEPSAALRVCIDTASPTAGRDRGIAEGVANRAKLTLAVTPFNGGGDDDGVSVREFRKLLAEDCDLVMGYPVDASAPSLPPGLLATKPYAETGFVLVTVAGLAATTLADLPAGTDVAVTYGTAPNLYFADHGNVQPDIQTDDVATMREVASGAVKAAMVWQPTIEAFQAHNPDSRLGTHPLHEPHARYGVVALYLPQSAHQAGLFGATKISVDVPAAQSMPAPPALYTAAQAKIGYVKFLGNCAMCHGTHLEGRSGPSLKGPNWANAKADYTVGEVFTVVSQQMPATSPGSLPQDDYVTIMAYLLQQNGYPAGAKPLDFSTAAASKTALLWHGG